MYRNRFKWAIWGFLREVTENCALMCYYAASSDNFLQTFRDNLSFPSSGFKNPEPLPLLLINNSEVCSSPQARLNIYRRFEVIQKEHIFCLLISTHVKTFGKKVAEHKCNFQFSLLCFFKFFFLAKLFVWRKNSHMRGKV